MNGPISVLKEGQKEVAVIMINLAMTIVTQRIRLDCESGANHNLNRLLYKPGGEYFKVL